MTRPILYSFRRCPYAMRARMAVAKAGISYELREVLLRDKPAAMLDLSAKGTVPVLQVDDLVLDESLDIMLWALKQADPDGWLQCPDAAHDLIRLCDDDFKVWLDRYKYNDREPDWTLAQTRGEGERFLAALEGQLAAEGDWLYGRLGLADVAIFPFIRQFAFVDKGWFDQSEYERLKGWLASLLESKLFLKVMFKHKPWQPGQAPVLIGEAE